VHDAPPAEPRNVLRSGRLITNLRAVCQRENSFLWHSLINPRDAACVDSNAILRYAVGHTSNGVNDDRENAAKIGDLATSSFFIELWFVHDE
jgi:hypothetical protein